MLASAWTKMAGAIGRLSSHPDGRTALANTVALVILSNQPFYPLYLRWAVSPVIWPSFLTFLSTPLFLAAPLLARRSALLGRGVMLAAGIGNTLLCIAAFGAASGVAVFLFPCLILSMLLFMPERRGLALGFAALCFAILLAPIEQFIEPLHHYTADEYAAFQRLNLLSAASLTALIGWVFARERAKSPRDA
ncbi:hypothetical protein [Bosea sp. (in: a-proteobacteria)]|uniref:hypothetical protein n=1 Tax=Bosea sp. (in: a-proteobacteria) TaxID=1871050 RepID=UPI003B3BD8F5